MAQTVDTDVNTKASRIMARGGGGLPEPTFSIGHECELALSAIANDPTLSDDYKRQRTSEIKEAALVAIRAERDRAIAADQAEIAREEAVILGEIRGTSRDRSISTELDSERAERQHRATQDAFGLLTSQLALQATNDPTELQDAFEEALESAKPARVRAIGLLVMRNLEQGKRAKRPGAAEAHALVSTLWMQFNRQHPSPMTRLRTVRANKQHRGATTASAYSKAEDYFGLGAAHGTRLL